MWLGHRRMCHRHETGLSFSGPSRGERRTSIGSACLQAGPRRLRRKAHQEQVRVLASACFVQQCLEMTADLAQEKMGTSRIHNQVTRHVEIGRVCGDKIHHPREDQPGHQTIQLFVLEKINQDTEHVEVVENIYVPGQDSTAFGGAVHRIPATGP